MKQRSNEGLKVAIAFLVGIAIAATLFGITTGSEARRTDRIVYASIVMPDGSVVSGECQGYDRNDRYVTVYMGDRVYKVSDWRVAIWYDRK